MIDARRLVIAKVYRETLTDLLAGRLECLNFPEDGVIDAMIVDIASDSIMVRIASSQFPVVPQFERIPDFELKTTVLLSAASSETH